jgi:hypothetical protein
MWRADASMALWAARLESVKVGCEGDSWRWAGGSWGLLVRWWGCVVWRGLGQVASLLIDEHVRLHQAGWVGEECQEMDVIKEDSRGRTASTYDRMLLLLRRHGMIREIVYGYTEEGDTVWWLVWCWCSVLYGQWLVNEEKSTLCKA